MLTDFETVDPAEFADRVYDVAVIGSGPAGISLARRLAAKGWTVGLFEGGGLELSADSQDIYKGDIVGQDYFPLDVPRLRYFGGTSNHWSGWSRRFDAYDFLPNQLNPLSGWPIGKSDLDPYAPEAASIIDLPEAAGAEMEGAHEPATQTEMKKGFDRMGFFYSPPTRFKEKYLGEILRSRNIHLFVNANLVDLKLSKGLSAASEGLFRGYARDGAVAVKARYFALCLGGIENPRFLLNCNSQIRAGIGNENDLVGRFFSEHPHIELGHITNFFYQRGIEFFIPKKSFLEQHRVLNFGLRVKSLLAGGAPKSLMRHAVCLSDFNREAVLMLSGKSWLNCEPVLLQIACEQALNPDSRVLLGDARDGFGKRRAVLDWRLSPIDFHTMRVAAREFGRVLAVSNIGRLKIADWLMEEEPAYPTVDTGQEIGGSHHMCTTRMSDDPKTGVVNADCRVHGIDNLYIGGSSVFASGGHANPTFSIVQLALRMGDHLDARLRG
jgi:hypothetical protein